MNVLKDKLKLFLGWPLSIVSLFFIGKFLFDRLGTVSTNLENLNLVLLFLSALLLILFFFFRSLQWGLILKYLGYDVKPLDNTYKYSVSELKRYIPGNIWSFLARGFQFREIGVSNKAIGKAILFEVQATIAGAGIASLPAITYILNSPQELKSRLITLLPISIVAAIIFFAATVYLFRKKYKEEDRLKFGQIANLILFSTAIFIIFGLANYLIFLSVFPISSISEIELIAFFSFAFLLGYLSFITPMGLGVREGVLTLGLIKITTLTNASFFAIFSRIILVISELLYVGVVLLVFKLRRQKYSTT